MLLQHPDKIGRLEIMEVMQSPVDGKNDHSCVIPVGKVHENIIERFEPLSGGKMLTALITVVESCLVRFDSPFGKILDAADAKKSLPGDFPSVGERKNLVMEIKTRPRIANKNFLSQPFFKGASRRLVPQISRFAGQIDPNKIIIAPLVELLLHFRTDDIVGGRNHTGEIS